MSRAEAGRLFLAAARAAGMSEDEARRLLRERRNDAHDVIRGALRAEAAERRATRSVRPSTAN